MARLRVLSGREVCRILASHGFTEVRRRGSHVVMQKADAEGTVRASTESRGGAHRHADVAHPPVRRAPFGIRMTIIERIGDADREAGCQEALFGARPTPARSNRSRRSLLQTHAPVSRASSTVSSTDSSSPTLRNPRNTPRCRPLAGLTRVAGMVYRANYLLERGARRSTRDIAPEVRLSPCAV